MSSMEEKRVPVMQADGTLQHWRRKVVVDPEPTHPEDAATVALYGKALKELADEDRRYLSNYNLWQRWGDAHRLWWIGSVERQAQAGKDTIGVRVVTRAAMIRLSEGL